MLTINDIKVGNKLIIDKSAEFSDWSWGYEVEVIDINNKTMNIKLINKHGNNGNTYIKIGIEWSWNKDEKILKSLSLAKRRTAAEKLFLEE